MLLWLIKKSESEFQPQFSLFDTPPKKKKFIFYSLKTQNPVRKCLCLRSAHTELAGFVCVAPFWAKRYILSPLLPVITQSFLLSEGSLQMTRPKHVQRTCCSNDTSAVTDGAPRTAETFWCILRTMRYNDENCSCCLLSASRPTSPTGTLSTTSMRTTPQTFGNFQSKTNVLHSRLHCIHTGARTYLQWSCKDSCWGLRGLRELVHISLLLEKCCSLPRKHIQKVISAPRRVGGRFLVRRNAASAAAACVETALRPSTVFTRLHLLPQRTCCSKRVEYKLTVTLRLKPSHSCQMLCCFPESREVKTIRTDAERPIKTIYSQSFLRLAPLIFLLALCTLACVHQCLSLFPLFCYLNFHRVFFFWTSSLHFLIIKMQGKCHFRAHQLERPADWKQMGKKLCMCSWRIILS